MLPDPRREREPGAADLPPSCSRRAWLHVSGYALLRAGPARGGARDASSARAGMPMSVDPASAAPLRDAGFLDLDRGRDLLLPNADEAAVLGDALAGAYPRSS